MRRKHRRSLFWVTIIVFTAVIVSLAGSAYPGLELLFVLAIAPSCFLLWFFHHADKYKAESLKLLSVTFAIGGLSTIPAVLLESELSSVLSFGLNSSLLVVVVYLFLGVGLVEESLKFFSVRVYAYRSPHFDEAMDGIVLGVAAALGFATVENVSYVLTYGVATALTRALVSVPGHAFWGAIIGFYLGESKVKGKFGIALRGLAIAVLLHGLFDTLTVTVPYGLVAFALLVVLVVLVYFVIVKREIGEAEEESPFRPKDDLAKR